MKSDLDTKTERMKVSVIAGDLSPIQFQISPSTEGTAYFCLGVRKSGSTMLNRLVVFLARQNDIPIVDIPGRFFKNGYSATGWADADLSHVIRPNNIYVGFRTFPKRQADYEVFQNARKIFMFRDPRDALVSQYFSDAYSHPLPSAVTETATKAAEAFLKKRDEVLSTDIDTYVIQRSQSFLNTLMAYAPMLSDPNCLVLRYEDYVFQKKKLIHKILRHFDWQCAPEQVENLLTHVDAVPDTEDEKKFVRQVSPGDHRRKLAAETIRALDDRLQRALETFDYY